MQTNQFRAALGRYPQALITPRPDPGQLGTRPVPGAYRSHSHWKSEVCPPASPPPSCRNHRRGCHSQPPLALLPPDPPNASMGVRGGGPCVVRPPLPSGDWDLLALPLVRFSICVLYFKTRSCGPK